LAAILAADVVGYSALMGADEARALAVIRLLREDLFEPEVARWRGAVVKRLGDGWLVEFPSAVDAVRCALAVQDRMAEVDDVELRIGVHIGDIVHDGDDIYGDGVNIAARLEAAGAAGHVLISDDVRRHRCGCGRGPRRLPIWRLLRTPDANPESTSHNSRLAAPKPRSWQRRCATIWPLRSRAKAASM
jgi:class 3 adenylate cyclase